MSFVPDEEVTDIRLLSKEQRASIFDRMTALIRDFKAGRISMEEAAAMLIKPPFNIRGLRRARMPFMPGILYDAQKAIDARIDAFCNAIKDGSFPFDAKEFGPWLKQQAQVLTEEQRKWYDAVQGRGDPATKDGQFQDSHTRNNSLDFEGDLQLIQEYFKTRDPALLDELKARACARQAVPGTPSWAAPRVCTATAPRIVSCMRLTL